VPTDDSEESSTPNSASGAAPRIDSAGAQPTGVGAPAYVVEPDAQTLKSDLIVDNGAVSDVYVSSAQDTADGPVHYAALFSDASAGAAGLHVDATGSTWNMIHANGAVIASATPTRVQ
jgi:hypothetical protein